MTAEAKTKGDATDMKEKKKVGLFECFMGHLSTFLSGDEVAKFKESIKTDSARDLAATAVFDKAQVLYKGAHSEWRSAYQFANAVHRIVHAAALTPNTRVYICCTASHIARPLIVIV
jgi:hypothetical protein